MRLRAVQRTIIEKLVSFENRVKYIVSPNGTGKTRAVLVYASARANKVLYLSPTHEQLKHAVQELEIVNEELMADGKLERPLTHVILKGKMLACRNQLVQSLKISPSVFCQVEGLCSIQDCEYDRLFEEAKGADIVFAPLAYFNTSVFPFNDMNFDMLLIDEAHNLPFVLINRHSISFSHLQTFRKLCNRWIKHRLPDDPVQIAIAASDCLLTNRLLRVLYLNRRFNDLATIEYVVSFSQLFAAISPDYEIIEDNYEFIVIPKEVKRYFKLKTAFADEIVLFTGTHTASIQLILDDYEPYEVTKYYYNNLDVKIFTGVSFKYSERSENTYSITASLISEVLNIRENWNNALVFSSSYAVQENILKYFKSKYKTVVFDKMTADENTALINEFKSSEKSIAFTVFHGRNNEGVDFPEDIIDTTFIIGVPFENWNKVTERLIKIYGFDKYYVSKAANRTIQAIGRGLRALSDTNNVLMIDKRFCHKAIRKHFPDYIKRKLKVVAGVEVFV